MLGATFLLHGVAKRIFDRRAAGFAAALFAGLASVQYLGAFATYDAMALFLVSLASWLGVRALEARPSARFLFLIAAGCTLALADAAKYAAALFTLIVLAVVVSIASRLRGPTAAARAGMLMSLAFSLSLAGALLVGGHPYIQGVEYTTLARTSSNSAAPFLLYVSGKWEGSVLVLGIVGAATAICTSRRRSTCALALTLAVAGFLVPVEQARIHTYTSLFKHIGYGAWFSAIAGGYALASLLRAVPPVKAAMALRVAAAAVVLAGIPSIPWAPSHFGWPNASRLVPVMRGTLRSTRGPLLLDERGNVLDYYVPQLMIDRPVVGTWFFAFNDPATGRHLIDGNAYAAAIREHYFSVIMLEFWDTAATDKLIESDINKSGGYRLVADIPYPATGAHGNYLIWVRQQR
jgi:hypothetical protein